MNRKNIFILLLFSLTGCSSLLPHSDSTTISPWKSYEEVQKTFDKIHPHQSHLEDLKKLHLMPGENPNIAILNYSDVLRRFIPSPSVNANDLDAGVQECILAKQECTGYELNQSTLKKKRYGNFWADLLNFKRKTDIVGWKFHGVILLKKDLVIYKLTGGEPSIHEFEESRNPLGPLQGFGEAAVIAH